jgi:hypothetical protein
VPLEAGQIQQRGQAQAFLIGKQSVWIAAFTESLVYRCDTSGQEQIRAVVAGLFEGSGTAPFGDFGVVAAYEDFGDFPTTEVRRARVVGKFQQDASRDA